MIRDIVRRFAALIASGPGGDGAKRLMHAGFWVFSLRVTDRGMRLLRTIVLSRLLFPEDIGLFGIALLMLSGLETFSMTGFTSALIHKQDDIGPYLDTAWTIQVIRGLVLAALLSAAAPLAASFFDEPAVHAILQVIALKFVFTGLANIGIIDFHKKLEFHKEFRYHAAGAIVDFPVAIAAAWFLRDAWALVWGVLAGEFARTTASYLIHSYRPKLRFDLGQARDLFTYGRWIMAREGVVFLSLQGDDGFVGRVLGAAALGVYQVAFRIANVTFSGVSRVVSDVIFPYYSTMQDDAARLKRSFLATVDATLTVAFPLAAGVLVLAPTFVELFLGDGWGQTTRPLQMLVLAGSLLSIHATGTGLFKASGQPDRDLWMNLAKVVAMAVTIYPLSVRWGLNGVAVSVVIGNAATLPLWWSGVTNIIRCTRMELLRSMLPAATGGVFTAMSGAVARFVVPGPPAVSFVVTAVAMALGFVVYELTLRGERRPMPAGGVGMLLRALQSD